MSDDLNTQIKIGADASGVEVGVTKAKRSLKSLGDAAKQAGKDGGSGVEQIGAGGDRAAKKVESATRSMQNSIQRLIAEQSAGGKASRAYYEALADTKGINRNAIKPLLDQLDAAKAKTAAAESATNSWRSSLDRVGPAVAAAFSLAALAGAAGKVIAVQREFDVLNASLKTVTGSSAAAERELAWLKDFAKETPFGLAQATQGFVKMKALGLDPTRESLTSFGNTASALGKNLNQMIEAVADASTGEFERLKEFGIKARQQGDQVSLTFQGITKTIGNNAAEITRYLEDIGNVEFAGAMAERAKTLDGAISALGDSWDELFRTVSSGNVGGLIFDSVTLANGALEDATTILRALGGAAQDAGRDTGALSTIQSGLATAFETVAVLGANVAYVLKQTGNEIGGLVAQIAQFAKSGGGAFMLFDVITKGRSVELDAIRSIRKEMVADAEEARRQIDATTARILSARGQVARFTELAARGAGMDEPRFARLMSPAGVPVAAPACTTVVDKSIAAANRELEAQAKLLLEINGLTGSFYDDWDRLGAVFNAGKISLEQLTNEQAKLLAKQPAIKQGIDAEAKATADAAAARESYVKSLTSGLDNIQADTTAQIEATKRMGLSKEAVSALDVAKLEMIATDLDLQAIKVRDVPLDERAVELLKQQANAYRDLAQAKQAGTVREVAIEAQQASDKAAQDALAEWQKTADGINQSLTDALLRGFESGKDFARNLRDTVVNMFKTLVLRPVISAVLAPLAGGLGSLVPGAAAAGQGGSALSALGSLGSLAGAFGTGIASSFTSIMSAGIGGWATAAGSLIGSGATAGIAAGLGMIAAPVALAAALWKPLFGRKLQDSGIEGTFGGATGFEGNSFEYLKGGLLRSNKTNRSALDEATRAGFGNAFNSLRDQVGSFADSIGLQSEKLAGYTSTIKLSLKDLSPEDAQKKITEALQVQGNALADLVLTSGFARAGEESIETLSRLSTSLTTVNGIFDTLGTTLLNASLTGADAASKLVDAFGGLESLAQSTSAYFQAFYSEEERTRTATRQIGSALGAVGVAMPDAYAADALAQYRALVEAQDLSTDAGRTAYAALVQLSSGFADVAGFAQRQSQTLADEALKIEQAFMGAADAAVQAAGKISQAIYGAAQSNTDGAFSSLQRAVEAQREIATAARSAAAQAAQEIGSVLGLLSSGMRDLYGEVASTSAASATSARAFVATALQNAQATGYLPDAAGLSEAISLARAGGDAGYSSQTDMDRDRLVLAGQLSSLAELAKPQLSAAELAVQQADAQLKLLDSTLKTAREQIDALRGIDVSVKTIPAALESLQTTLVAELRAQTNAFVSGLIAALSSGSIRPQDAAAAYTARTGGAVPRDQWFDAAGTQAYVSSGGAVALGGGADSVVTSITGDRFTLKSAADYVTEAMRTGNLRSVYDAAVRHGIGSSSLDALMGWPAGTALEWAKGQGLPSFAVGTNYVPGDMTARIHEGERIVPAADNRALMAALNGGGSQKLEALVTQLVEENRAQAGEIVRLNLRMARVFERWDGEGLPEERVVA